MYVKPSPLKNESGSTNAASKTRIKNDVLSVSSSLLPPSSSSHDFIPDIYKSQKEVVSALSQVRHDRRRGMED